MKNISLFVFIMCFLQPILGQQKNGLETKADKYYQDLGYSKYIEVMGEGDWSSYSRPTLIKLGDSYRKTGDFKNAEKVYQRLIQQEDDSPLHHLYYAQALQANGQHFKAGQHYEICHQQMEDQTEHKDDRRAFKGYNACNQIADFKARGNVIIRNVKELNTPKLDFSPTYYNDGLVFVSTRDRASLEKIDLWTNDNCMDLYTANLSGEKFEKPASFSDDLNTKFHEGPVSFTDDKQTIFFTRNNYQNGKRGKSKDRITKLKIYSAKLKKGLWREIKELPFNHENEDACHPTLSDNEDMMVFSSSNGENHQGGMDLYVSYWQGENWTEPVNLGPEINTAGNELFPYLHHDGRLYYASNGHGGLGGLDMFMAQPIGEDDKGAWGFSLNLGAPFNSHSDDFGIILNRKGEEGYFTSNRKGGVGQDDIYHFKLEEGSFESITPQPLLPMEICVFDKTDDTRIEGAIVNIRKVNSNMAELSDADRKKLGLLEGKNIILSLTPVREGANEYAIQIKPATDNLKKATEEGSPKEAESTYYTNDEGTFLYSMYANEEYLFEVQKDGYVVAEERFLMPPNSSLEEFCIGLEKRTNLFAGNDPNANGNPNNGTNPSLIDPNNLVGPDGKPLDLSKPYVTGVVLNKEYNRPLPRTEVTLLNRCTGEETVVKVDESGLFAFPLECGCDYVVKARKNNFIGSNKILSLVKSEDCKPVVAEMLMTPGFDKLGEPVIIAGRTITESLKEGDIIEMRDIYYDFDKYYIRDDASPDLDRLTALMIQFPSMHVELSSHTDSRGTFEYNEKLSSNRAKSAREYLIRKGIEASRITAIGFGENRPRNKCRDGVDCNEYEHQRNRRTEVLITRFDQAEYIKVYYKNNQPTTVDPKRN